MPRLLLLLCLMIPLAAHATDLPAQFNADTLLTLANSPYLLQTSTSINAGVTVTVEPGVEIVAAADTRLFVNGTLAGGSNAGAAIVLRAQDPLARGAWAGVYVAPTGHLRLTNATISNGVNSVMAPGGEVTLASCQLTLASEDALFAWGSCVLDCSGCTFADATGRGVYLEGYQATGTIRASTFSGNGSYPAQVKAPLAPIVAAGNTFIGNGIQRLGVSCSLAEDITGLTVWPALAIPLELGAGGGDQTLTIGAGGELRVSGGTTVLSTRIECRGRLQAVGTAAQPVVFTPLAEAATPGGWAGLLFQPGSTCALAYANVLGAETGVTADGANVGLDHVVIEGSEYDGARITGASVLDLNETTFRNNGRCGLRLEGPGMTGIVQNCDFLTCGSNPVWALAQNLRCLLAGNAYAGNAVPRIGVSCGGTPDVSTGDHVWVAQGLPLDCTVSPSGSVLSIASGASLTIAGAQVVHAGAIDVYGRLTVASTAAEPCLFLPPPGSDAAGSWNGLRFIGGQGSLRGAVVRLGANGLSLANASPTIRDCVLCDSQYDGLSCTGTSQPIITGSAFMDNGRHGVNVMDTAQPNLGNIGNTSLDDDGRNTLRGNGGYEVYNGSAGDVRVQNCTWSSTSSTAIAGRVYDRWDNSARGVVVYLPIRSGDLSGTVLSWTGAAGYEADGVEPDVLTPGATAQFRVLYKQPQGRAPLFVRLHVQRGGSPLAGSPFEMALQGAAAYTTGAVYGADVTLPAGRDLRYWFAAAESGGVAVGPATLPLAGPVVNTSPRLTFSGESGYASDGVEPNAGRTGESYVFRCVYTDAEGDEPTAVRCVLLRGGVAVAGSPFAMAARNTASPTVGRGYELTRALATAGTYSVRFEADDGVGAATGPAAVAKTGPTVSAVGPVVSGLVALQMSPQAVQARWRQGTAATVSLDILNLAGRTVARVCRNIEYAAGDASADWPRQLTAGTLAPAGRYVLVLDAVAEDGTRWRATAPLQLR